MDEHARYGSLRDYLRVLRSQQWLVLFLTFVAGGTALGLSLAQEKSYEASAAMSFQDVSQDVSLIGNAVPARDAPAVLAAQSAATIERADVVERVARSLQTPITPDELRDSISAVVATRSNLVTITARADDPVVAARTANSFARETETVVNEQAKERFTDAARELRARVQRIRKTLDATEKLIYQNQLSRLDSLGTFARAASIAEFARPRTDPVAPKPVRNTIFGILVGLTLGLLFAFLRDALDRRLRTAADVRTALDLPVIGYVRAEALRQRFYDKKRDTREVGELDLEAFRIMRRNLEFLDVDRPVHVVAITSALPEEGKSTVAASLAVAAATGGRSVLLLECDLRRPTLAERIGGRPTPGLSDYLVGDVEPADVVQVIDFHDARRRTSDDGPSGPRLAYVPAGTLTPEPADLLASNRFKQLLTDVRAAYDLVIIDTSPLLPVVDTLEFLPEVDGVILCVRVGQTTRDQAQGARNAIDRLPTRPVGVVVTGTRADDDSSYGSYGNTYAYSARSPVGS